MFERLRDLISEKLGVEKDDVLMETSFADDLDADSIALFELIMAIEEEFDIEVEDESIENIITVGDILKYLETILES